jgi:hypothetical protein
LWCSAATLLLLAVTFLSFFLGFCIGTSCYDVSPIYGYLVVISGAGFLVGLIATVVMSLRALVSHRQPLQAVLALGVTVIPVVLLVGFLALTTTLFSSSA